MITLIKFRFNLNFVHKPKGLAFVVNKFLSMPFFARRLVEIMPYTYTIL